MFQRWNKPLSMAITKQNSSGPLGEGHIYKLKSNDLVVEERVVDKNAITIVAVLSAGLHH